MQTIPKKREGKEELNVIEQNIKGRYKTRQETRQNEVTYQRRIYSSSEFSSSSGKRRR